MFNEIKCTSAVVTQNFCIGEDLNFLQKVNKNLFKRVMIKILLSVNCGLFNCSSTIYIRALLIQLNTHFIVQKFFVKFEVQFTH